jgi:hypothetical protein
VIISNSRGRLFLQRRGLPGGAGPERSGRGVQLCDRPGVLGQRPRYHQRQAHRYVATRMISVVESCSDSVLFSVGWTGAVRVSFGHHSTLEDCDAFLAFLRAYFLNKMPPTMGAPPRETTDGVDKCVADINDLIRTPLLESTQGASLRVVAPVASIPSAKDSTAVTLAAIFVYPIKSCAGYRSAPLGFTPVKC